MTTQELQAIILSGEGYKTEFKRTINSDLAKELVAFANSSGGRIFIGIDDDGSISGVNVNNELRSRIESIARDCDPAVDIQIDVADNILVLQVPEGKDKPYRCTSGFYIRNGSSSVKLSTREIIDFIQTEGKIKFDELRVPELQYPLHLDQYALKNYISLLQLKTTVDPENLLVNFGILVHNGREHLFNTTGVMFFGQDPAKYIPQAIVTCVAYKGTGKVDIIDRKDFNFDFIGNIEQSIAFIKRHLNISYKIEGTRRDEILELPEVALREAVVNAVAHRDYFEKGANVMIEVFDDRVEITNPGGLPKGLNEENFGHRTLARNPLIASLLNRAGYIEKLGTGIQRIKSLMKESGLPEPVFTFDGFFCVVLKREYTPVQTLQIDFKVTEPRRQRLNHILQSLSESKLSVKEEAARFNVTEKVIRIDLLLLERKGYIKSEGTTTNRSYKLTHRVKGK